MGQLNQNQSQLFCQHLRNWTHALVELIFGFVSRYDCPAGAVIDHLLVRLLGARCCLKLYDLLLGQAQVHAICVLHVEGAFVQLRHRIIGLQQRHLFIHFAYDQTRQRHARHRADKLHRGPIVYVAVAHLKLFRFRFIVIEQMYRECAPLRGRRMKVSVLHMQIAGRDSLGAQAIEERHIGAAGYAQVGILERLLLLGRLRDDLNALRVEHANVVAIAIEHFHRQHEMLPFVRVGYEERLGRTVLFAIEIQLLHVLVTAADANECAQLCPLLALALLQHLLVASPPSAAKQVDAGWGAEETLLIAIGFLGHLQGTITLDSSISQLTTKLGKGNDYISLQSAIGLRLSPETNRKS